jgi:hypothetical protein
MLRARPSLTPMHRGRLPTCSCRHARVDGPERPSGRNAYPRGITPSTIMSPTRSHPGPRTEIRPGARAHAPCPIAPARRLSSASRSALRAAQGGDRAPPPALNQRSRVAHATQQHQPGSRACRVVPAQIRSTETCEAATHAQRLASRIVSLPDERYVTHGWPLNPDAYAALIAKQRACGSRPATARARASRGSAVCARPPVRLD